MGSGNPYRDFGVDFLLSGIAAAISKTAFAPIERVNLQIQYQNMLINSGKLDKRYMYNGFWDCFANTFYTKGPLAFWQGNLPNVIRYFCTQALNFAFKDYFKKNV